ncbi:MAG: hypothetical protein ACRDC6_02305 [Shewanella sp.]
MPSENENIALNEFISNSCVLVIQSCDAYEDVWQAFFSALREYWPNCKLEIILNTETKTVMFDSLNTNKVNRNSNLKNPYWGERLLNVLKFVDKEFVITLFDDFIIEDKVNVERIAYCINNMIENESIGVFYFNNVAITKNKHYDGFCKLNSITDYKVNSCPAIWRKKVLQEMTGVTDNPWAWEFFGSARAYGEKYEFHCVTQDSENVFVYQYQLGGAIRRGKWVRDVIMPAIEKYDLLLEPSIRGFSSASLTDDKYSISWKVNFIKLGFKMVGVKAVIPLLFAVSHKIKRVLQ